jgi:hypothetical protein
MSNLTVGVELGTSTGRRTSWTEGVSGVETGRVRTTPGGPAGAVCGDAIGSLTRRATPPAPGPASAESC